MIASHPPRLADWLLLRLASGPRHLSLIGDLHEQYERGRSAAWYWRQTVKAILARIASDLRRHPAELFQALCMGLGSWSLYGLLITWPASWLFQHSAAMPWGRVPLGLIGGWLVGWTVRRFHPERLAAALLLLILVGHGANLFRVFGLSVYAWSYPHARLYLWLGIISLAIPTVGILIGGLSDLRPSEENFQINKPISAE